MIAATGRVLCILVLAGVAAILLATPSHAATIHPIKSCRAENLSAVKAIKCYWPRQSRPLALIVAECESTASASEPVARRRHLGRWAVEQVYGTHVGIFQLGIPERRRYGWYEVGAPARVQVKAAVKLFLERGWQPWVCQP